GDGFTTLNTISTLGSFLLGASMFPFLFNVWKTWRTAPLVNVDDPWGWGASLEWATSCPPPRHNFTRLPRIRSERPAFDLHHPELVGHPRLPVPVGAGAPGPITGSVTGSSEAGQG